ncbi:isochorismatase family protein family [Ophiostoma piceae UAMH 11346]|uniref:Isochorismatase family protein family n=1 Tax=Ophiostoma piceae (strain UAMH 11346) TaxID=1262450 RepID=S3CKF2_OPHP1|nr:isochorismatase family protein family [Ophiostoma piceae UAMH 11346]
MPPTLPIDLSNFPAFQTRKALLIIDLQNEFLSSGSGLHVSEPAGYLERGLDVAKKFRESGAGDVFWIRSQFDAHRPTANARIITSSTPSLSGMRTASSSSSGSVAGSQSRRKGQEPTGDAEPDQDADPEAFLSIEDTAASSIPSAAQKPQGHFMTPGCFGSEMAPQVAAAINTRQDFVITKSHYSAFDSTQLLTRLRTRFITELYIFGALTNISIYATALDAARHGLMLTIVEDCCGYRDAMRHNNALRSLVRLTGCETVLADHVLDTLPTASARPYHLSASEASSSSLPPVNDFAAAIAAITASSHGPPGARRIGSSIGSGGPSLPVRSKTIQEVSSSPSTAVCTAPTMPSASLTRSANPTVSVPVLPSSSTTLQPSLVLSPFPRQSAPATDTLPPEAESKPRTASPPVAVEKVNMTSTISTRLAHSIVGSAIDTTPALGLTRVPSQAAEVDVGGITPDDSDNASEGGSDPGDSFIPVLPSRTRPAKTSKTLSGTAGLSQPASSMEQRDTPSEIPASVAPKVTGREIAEVAEAPEDSNLEISDPKVLGPNAPETTTSKPEMPDAEISGPDKAAAEAADVLPSMQENTKDRAPGSMLYATSKSTAQPEPALDIVGTPVVPVDTTKKPASTEPICAGDTIIYHNVLPAALEDGIYERLRDEVQWQRMSHQGGEVPRLVCVQGEAAKGSSGDANEDDTIPVYRHPADESPPLERFTPTVQQIKRHIESIVGHPLNHALIQYYRSGNDYISEHSDKTLDIVPGSYVCNMSLGAERMMIFRTKRPDKDESRELGETASGDQVADGGEGIAREKASGQKVAAAKRQSCRVQLPHNSLCRMGLETNTKWLHAIRQDKRADRDKSEPEMAFGGGRISLTFRRIGTFLNKSETLIWGQGAVAKTRAEARPVINGQSDEAISMLRAFGTENHSSSFDWARYYGHGFDVLHMSSAPRFFASTDKLVDTTIQLFLAELGINHARGSLGSGFSKPLDTDSTQSMDDTVVGNKDAAKATKEEKASKARPQSSLETAVRFVDNDRERSTVHGLLAILLYVDLIYGAGSATGPNSSSSPQISSRDKFETAQVYTRLQQAILLQDSWRPASFEAAQGPSSFLTTGPVFSLKLWENDLVAWNAFVLPKLHAGKTDKDDSTNKLSIDEVLFIAGGSSPSLADYALWPVLHGMEQACDTASRDTDSSNLGSSSDSKAAQLQGPPSAFLAELTRLGMPNLARYYVQVKARASFERVMLAREK